MANEEWRDIRGFENKYQVSNFGRVRSLIDNKGNKRELIRKPRITKNGYLYLNLFMNSNCFTKKIHRLVAETFLENKNTNLVVNHKNGNKQDNNVENLEWTTYSENTLHALKMGLSKINNFENGSKNIMYGKRLGKSPFAKVVIQLDKDGKQIKEWDCIKTAQEELKINHISDVCNGKRKMAGGYIWKYKIA